MGHKDVDHPTSDEGRNAFFAEEARKAHDTLATKEKKALALIIDDDRDAKLRLTEAMIAAYADFVISTQITGEDGISMYQAFRESDPGDTPSTVVLVMDSRLAGPNDSVKYKTGIEVLTAIAQISEENGWNMPYVIGNSSDESKNLEFYKAYPNEFVGSLRNNPDDVFQGLEARIAQR